MEVKVSGLAVTAALAAGTLLLMTACSPSAGPGPADLERVGSSIARGETVVSVPALSRQVIEDQGNFRLVDLRSATEFEAGHIPGARNSSVTEVIRPDRAREIAGNRQLVLYSGDGIAASQASALLQLSGINAVTLQGGFDAWYAWTSNPAHDLPGQLPVLAAEERLAMAQFFHGEAVTPAATPGPASRSDRAAALGLTPAAQPDRAAALGLAPAAPTTTAAPVVSDPHGLGLQYGLGVGISFELAALEEAPAEETPAPRRRLLIGEGC